MKELLTRADPYNTIVNNIDDDVHTYVPCSKRCDSCRNFVVAKTSSKYFATKRIYKVRRSTSFISKIVIYIAFCLNCLKEGLRSIVDWKPRLRNYKSHVKEKYDLVVLLITLLMFLVTQMILQKMLDLLLWINKVIPTTFPLMRLILNFNSCHHT